MDEETELIDPQVLDVCGETPSTACEWVLERTDNEFLARLVDWLLARPLTILIIAAVAWLLTRLAWRAVDRVVRRLRDRPPLAVEGVTRRGEARGRAVNVRQVARAETVGTVLKSIASAIIWTTAWLMILAEVGIAIAPLLASAGIAGVALAFGAQSLVKDFLTGLFMILEDEYGVGDVVDLGAASGTVEAVTLRTTRLRAVDGTVWHVPNGEVRRVGNMSQEWSRAVLDVEVAYDTDLRAARAIIVDVARAVHGDPEYSDKILDPPETWGVESLGESAVAIRLVVKTLPGEQWGVLRELRLRLKEALDANDIEIPFPQTAVWMREAA